MHAHAEVWLPKLTEDIEAQIDAILAPFCENLVAEDDEEDDDRDLWWDWFQIGGRWTGVHDGYDPEKDPQNIEKCRYCAGTGIRTDFVGIAARERTPGFTCNGCNGTGEMALWPTERAPHAGDVISVQEIKPELTCARLIVAERMFYEADWEKGVNVIEKLTEIGITDGYLVTVDYHN